MREPLSGMVHEINCEPLEPRWIRRFTSIEQLRLTGRERVSCCLSKNFRELVTPNRAAMDRVQCLREIHLSSFVGTQDKPAYNPPQYRPVRLVTLPLRSNTNTFRRRQEPPGDRPRERHERS